MEPYRAASVMRSDGGASLAFFSAREGVRGGGKSARKEPRSFPETTLFIRDFLDRRGAHNRYRGLQWMDVPCEGTGKRVRRGWREDGEESSDDEDWRR